MTIRMLGWTQATCNECGKVFDLLDPNESEEAFYGHDCEGGNE